MTRSPLGNVGLMTAALAATLFAADAATVRAQCCGTPTVAYAPVVVQPAPVVRTGWYPGALLDRLRLRRWSVADATPTYAAAPAYTAGYAPAYTASYAPAATYTASYTPYVTAYAPLQQAVVQTSYVPAVSASPCTSCAVPTTVSYAPSTVYRPVEVAPVVQTVVAAPACSTCSVEAPCGACSTCSTVSQAGYVEATPVAADCPSCAPSSGTPTYYGESSASAQGGTTSGPPIPQPELPNVPAPAGTEYGAQRPADASGTTTEEKSVVDPKPEDDEIGPEADPAADASTLYEFQAPPLIAPQNDRTANRPTVDVHNAVYRQPVRAASRVSTTAAKVAAPTAQPAVDANGWYSVKDRN